MVESAGIRIYLWFAFGLDQQKHDHKQMYFEVVDFVMYLCFGIDSL